MPLDGGTAITSFVLQWKQDGDNHWEGISIPVSGEASGPQTCHPLSDFNQHISKSSGFFAPQTLWSSPTSSSTPRTRCVWQLPTQWEWAISQKTNLFAPWEYVSAVSMRSNHFQQPFAHVSSFPILHDNIHKSTLLAVTCFTDVHIINATGSPVLHHQRVGLTLTFLTFLCVIRDITETRLMGPLSAGEPDVPILSPIGMKVEGNTFYIPLQHVEQGASPLQHFTLRYREVTDAPSARVSTLYLQPSFGVLVLSG